MNPVGPESERALQELRSELLSLAQEPEEQIRTTLPGCISCELLSEFGWALAACRAEALDQITPERAEILQRLDDATDRMKEADFECGVESVVFRPKWAELRELSRAALRTFGWSPMAVREYCEIAPGVWQRPVVPAEPAPPSPR